VRDPAVPLADGHDVDVVVHRHRTVVLAGEQIADRVAVPARHDRRRNRHPVAEADRPRHPDAQPVQPRVGALRLELGQDLVDPVQDGLRSAADVGRLRVGGDRLELAVGDLDVDRRGAEVDRRETDVRVQLDERGPATAAGCGRPRLAGQPGGDQSLELGEHAGAGKVEPIAQLGAGGRALVAEKTHHPVLRCHVTAALTSSWVV
jgi:hypothetical protein